MFLTKPIEDEPWSPEYLNFDRAIASIQYWEEPHIDSLALCLSVGVQGRANQVLKRLSYKVLESDNEVQD